MKHNRKKYIAYSLSNLSVFARTKYGDWDLLGSFTGPNGKTFNADNPQELKEQLIGYIDLLTEHLVEQNFGESEECDIPSYKEYRATKEAGKTKNHE